MENQTNPPYTDMNQPQRPLGADPGLTIQQQRAVLQPVTPTRLTVQSVERKTIYKYNKPTKMTGDWTHDKRILDNWITGA